MLTILPLRLFARLPASVAHWGDHCFAKNDGPLVVPLLTSWLGSEPKHPKKEPNMHFTAQLLHAVTPSYTARQLSAAGMLSCPA